MTLDATELRKLHELKPCPKCLLMPFERSVLFCDHPCHRPEPASETFEQAWAATGYHYGEDALVELPVDSGMNAESVERAEFLWASLPTMRKWTSLATHEKALVCHLLDHELAASKAKLEAADEVGWLIEMPWTARAGGQLQYVTLAADSWPKTNTIYKSRRGRNVEACEFRSPIELVADASKALRFARKRDAEAFIKLFDRFLLHPIAAEHIWQERAK